MLTEAAGQRAALETPEALFGRFTQTFGQLGAFMESLSTSDWNKPTSLSFGGEMAVHRLVRIAISELALHSWDIRSTFTPHAELTLPSQRELSTSVLGRFFRIVERSDFPLVDVDPVRYRFQVVGQVERADDIVVAEETARLEPATSNAAHVEYRMNASDFILVFYKRLRLGPLTTAGRVQLDGEATLARLFDAWLDTKELP